MSDLLDNAIAASLILVVIFAALAMALWNHGQSSFLNWRLLF